MKGVEVSGEFLWLQKKDSKALCREVRVDEALYRRRGPVREGVAYYDYVPEAPV